VKEKGLRTFSILRVFFELLLGSSAAAAAAAAAMIGGVLWIEEKPLH
jgi:hypothetical protein